MKKILLAVVGLLILAGGAFAMSDYLIPHKYRYKMIINVQTPNGLKSGHSVREIQIVKQPDPLPQMKSVSRNMKGEAAVIDLGEKGKLFALISSGSYYELLSAFDKMSGAFTDEGLDYLDNLKVGDNRELTDKSQWPQFVMFEDLYDPMSVKAINKKNISEQLGAGYTIQNIMIEITNEDIEWNIVSLLPWLKGLTSNIDGTKATSSNKLSNKLHVGNFIKGEK